MKADIKAKWVAALRSGQYEQTEGVLRNDKGYCCLGVLCDIYAKETGMEWVSGENEYYMHGNGNVLPYEVRVWADLPHEHGKYVGVTVDEDEAADPPHLAYPSLAELNDRWVYDFKKLAEVIEEQL